MHRILTKNTVRGLAGLLIGGTLSYGAYTLLTDIQVTIQDMPALSHPPQPLLSEPLAPQTEPVPEVVPQEQAEGAEASSAPKVGKEEREETDTRREQEQRGPFKEMNQLSLMPLEHIAEAGGRMIIVADLPYNPQFEQKIVSRVNQLRTQFPDLVVFRANLTDPTTKNALQTQLKANIREQTLFLLKHPYEKGASNIDFDVFMQFPQLLPTYLKDVPVHHQKNAQEVARRLAELSPHESCLLYLFDSSEPDEKVKQRMQAAKYIQMELIVSNLPSVRLQVVDRQAAIEHQLIDPATARTNSVHLFRKHNIYTPQQPNCYLGGEPFHRLADIALFAKGGRDLMVAHYLASLETFDAAANPAPFMCTLRVDRNRISDQDYTRLLRVFGQLKRENQFPQVSFALKLKEVPFGGKEVPKNKEWQVTITNVDELDREAMQLEVKNHEQSQQLGFKEAEYLKTTQEYLYEHSVISSELLKQFISKATKGQLPRHYKSEEPHPLAPMHALNSQQFGAQVLEAGHDHLVYEYSQFCPTCQRISPVVGAFAKVAQQKGLGLQGLQFHKMDATKNRVPGQLSSPYIPNIFYFKKEWKKQGPVRFPIEMLGSQGLVSLYAFCAITNELGTVEWEKVQKAIANANAAHQDIRDLL